MDTGIESKTLEHYDESGFEFVQEMLSGDPTAAVNFDRLQKHPKMGYIIFEYLLCDEKQHVTPYSSHPDKYMKKNRMKFLSLWKAALDFNATLYLVNYAKKGTSHENEVKVIKVKAVTCNCVCGDETKYTRDAFKEWFRQLNQDCLIAQSSLIKEISLQTSLDILGKIQMSFGKYEGVTFDQIDETDRSYLKWLTSIERAESAAAEVYLQKKISKSSD